MRALDEIAAALLVGAGHLALAWPVRLAGGRLVAALPLRTLAARVVLVAVVRVARRRATARAELHATLPARYVRKPHVPFRPYGRRIDPTGPAGRHRLTIRNRRTAYRPVVGHVRWHGHPDDAALMPGAVTAGIWTEES